MAKAPGHMLRGFLFRQLQLWFHLQGSRGIKMQLRDACVDIDGNLVVHGKLSFPTDDRRLFRPREHARLRVTRSHAFEAMRIAATEAERDANTGFFDRADRGSDVCLPPAIAEMVRRTLTFGAKAPDSLTLVGQHGFLAVSANQSKTNIRQPLSNWRIDTSEEDGNIHLRVSADLLRTRDRDVTDKGADNYWSLVAGVPPRLTIEFGVDPATRFACFGGWHPGGCRDEQTGAASNNRTSLDSLQLESARVGRQDQVFATDTAGRELSFYSTAGPFGDIISLEPAGTGYNPYPRFRFHGIGLDYVVRNIRECCLNVAFEGDCGELETGLVRDLIELEQNRHAIRKAEYVFELTLSGLRFVYRTNQIDGEALLAWEVLILRYPAFLRHRAAVKSAARRSMSTDEA